MMFTIGSCVLLQGVLIHGIDFDYVEEAKSESLANRFILVRSLRTNGPNFWVGGKGVLSVMHYAVVVVFLVECRDYVCVVLLKLPLFY